ncbi:MAG TPA: serine hydrolase domain-containing protein [Pirellulales bacterium]|nr:serine hydrolase domain-containing protein [Pirellulales bacterium]
MVALVRGADAPSAIASEMQKFVADQTIAGAVTLVAHHGKILSLNAVGQADLASGRPMKPDTMFWIASMTKPIAATAVMILQDDLKLSVDDPVGKYLPAFQSPTIVGGGTPSQPLTIRHLLTHTSGLSSPPPEVGAASASLADFVDQVAKLPLQFEPGSQWKYGVGLSVAGRIVEIVSGKSFEQFIAQRIFQPLEMNDTTFYPSVEQRQRLATIYRFNDSTKQLEPAPPPVFINVDPALRRAPNPSGGLASTAEDYYRFLQMVLNGGELNGKRVVSADAVQQMTSVQTGDLKGGFVPGSAWGLGWSLVREPQGVTASLNPGSYGHGGAFGTQAWTDPKLGAIYIMLIQRFGLPNSDASAMRRTFQQAAHELIVSPRP